MNKHLKYALLSGILGVALFGSIAYVVPGGWSTLESCVIGFWIFAGLGAFFSTAPMS